MDRSDAFDVITDPDLRPTTTNVKRGFALKLAAQVAYDAWYKYEDYSELADALKNEAFTDEDPTPEALMVKRLLEYSSSVDAKTLDVLRDVGVGAPQVGQLGVGAMVQQPQAAQGNGAPRRGFFSRRDPPKPSGG